MRTNFTPEEDAYIIANHGSVKITKMCEALGRTYPSVWEHIARLREAGKLGKLVKYHRRHVRDRETAREIITDGYDDVPWWCRQSTRRQVFRAQMYDAAYYYDQRKEASVNSELLDITQKI
jgi:hypothetical protein